MNSSTVKKKVWVNKAFEGTWDVPANVKSLGFRMPHDWVRAELVWRHGCVANDWSLIVAPADGTMEQEYHGLERSE